MSRLVSVSISALAAIALISPARLFAEQHTFVLDPERTSLTFELGATGHDVHGLLHATGGAVSFDTETGAASGEITLDARHTETGNRKRDKTMHKKVLESEAHPLIVFRPERVEGEIATAGSSELDLIGEVELLGASHELTLHTAATIENGEVAAKITFEIPYVEWGLHDPSTFILRVAKVVHVSVDAHGSLDATPAPTAAN